MSNNPRGFFPDDMDYISEEELAREEGFYIDDDGHWVPLQDDEYTIYDLGDPDDYDIEF